VRLAQDFNLCLGRMLKRSASIVLASLRSSTYPRGYVSGSSLAAALPNEPFEHPARRARQAGKARLGKRLTRHVTPHSSRLNCERGGRDRREKRERKFEVLGSKFRKPQTSDLEPPFASPVPLLSLVSPVSRGKNPYGRNTSSPVDPVFWRSASSEAASSCDKRCSSSRNEEGSRRIGMKVWTSQAPWARP